MPLKLTTSYSRFSTARVKWFSRHMTGPRNGMDESRAMRHLQVPMPGFCNTLTATADINSSRKGHQYLFADRASALARVPAKKIPPRQREDSSTASEALRT